MARLSDLIAHRDINTTEKEELIESLELILEMVKDDASNESEDDLLMETVEDIFNTILEESENTITYNQFKEIYITTFIEDEVENLWADYQDDPEDFKDSEKGDLLMDYLEDNPLTESLLHKTSSKKRRASKKYSRSAAGKKARKLATKKRKKFASRIKRCVGKGKSFSFKSMSCTKKRHRR